MAKMSDGTEVTPTENTPDEIMDMLRGTWPADKPVELEDEGDDVGSFDPPKAKEPEPQVESEQQQQVPPAPPPLKLKSKAEQAREAKAQLETMPEPKAPPAPTAPAPTSEPSIDLRFAKLEAELARRDAALAQLQAQLAQRAAAPVKASSTPEVDPISAIYNDIAVGDPLVDAFAEGVRGMLSDEPQQVAQGRQYIRQALTVMARELAATTHKRTLEDVSKTKFPELEGRLRNEAASASASDRIRFDFYGKYPELDSEEIRPVVTQIAGSVMSELGVGQWSSAVRDETARRVKALQERLNNVYPIRPLQPAPPMPNMGGGSAAGGPQARAEGGKYSPEELDIRRVLGLSLG